MFMRIIFIGNYRYKLLISFLIVALWVIMFFISDFLMENNLMLSIEIDNNLSFTCPLTFAVGNIYVNEQSPDNTIKTSSIFHMPRAQKFSSFKSPAGGFSFDYPSIFSIGQQMFEGNEIEYHIDFYDGQKIARGFVQVWNMPYPLDEFLQKSKESSLQDYKSFRSIPVKINGMPGYHWDYTVLGGDGKFYKGSEVFLKKGHKMYRISYFVPESMWDESQQEIFRNIVNSFKTY